ncbi:regulatory-associated protein of mTOR-like [Anneissia japonica]|uniref:regulatory-associated protein of mTOR-like n=1 Tax=Anneissia japonica TaxID=1529436 RepID=UPI0014255F62|nr:regulatory-associated protein of mTOR-like [Anneissia japonica]
MYDDITESEESELLDWQLPLAFMKKRHTEAITGGNVVTQTWRMKERMKTVSVALVLCLNVGVDPPDVVKTTPCARLECWIDPLSMSAQKALEAIGLNLQKQYERWQPRARYKQSLDPTVEEVKKLCTSLRRNAKEERVLFHYNGHGVPRPTTNGEIWVFNKSYTQYIPLSVYDLQTWMGSPSIFVYDCSNAGLILESFEHFSAQKVHERELATINSHTLPKNQMPLPQPVKNCIQLASCSSNQLLPMNPELPADLFTSCLTTPIKIALRWFCYQKSSSLVSGITPELVDKIPGQLNDRRTPLGELNWIFTAVTDTIAWNSLPRDLFQKLFRQDLLVASLFRNFLLAERIMRSYNCTPISSPRLPQTYQHAMWQAWDLAVDICLSQLPALIQGKEYKHSPFFGEQLTAFQVWLTVGSDKRNPPEQLPIVLQVLLSQVHRLRALDLLGRFLDLGPWAVSLALSVGIFPYVLKLLQSSARELRPLLVFIWAKILAVDRSCQADLVKDHGHKYFLSVLADPFMPAEHRTMAAFVLAMIVHDYRNGQEAALQGNVIAICLEQLNDSHPLLRQWLALCLARVWTKKELYHRNACGNTKNGRHVRLVLKTICQSHVAVNTVRRAEELVVSLYQLIQQFEGQFASVARQILEDQDMLDERNTPAAIAPGGWEVVLNPTGKTNDFEAHRRMSMPMNSTVRKQTRMHRNHSLASVHNVYRNGTQSSPSSSGTASPKIGSVPENASLHPPTMTRLHSNSWSSKALSKIFGSASNVYTQIWKVMLMLASDPHHEVKQLAHSLVNAINLKVTVTGKPRHMKDTRQTFSAPSSPVRNYDEPSGIIGGPPDEELRIPNEIVRPVALRPGEPAPPERPQNPAPIGSQFPHSHQFPRTRKIFDKGPTTAATLEDVRDMSTTQNLKISTEFLEWSCKYFARSVMKLPEEMDPSSFVHREREWRFVRNSRVRREAEEQIQRASASTLDDQIFINKNQGTPFVVKFHPYDPHIAVADKEGVCIWNWEQGGKINYFSNQNPRSTKITSMDFMNAHDLPLLFTGSDDGCVRIWREYTSPAGSGLELVTAWQALSEMLPSSRGSGLVVDWEQESGMLLASGDVRAIRVWDTQREIKLQDIPTGADSCITSLACDSVGRSLLIAGCGDGSVRLYDRRLTPLDSRVLTLREHSSWVVNVHLQKGGEGKIISASVSGDVRFWDPRFTESVKVINTIPNVQAMDVHQNAGILACGSHHQLISIYNLAGDTLSTIKYYEGFIGQRIGPINCLAFHPHRVHLAAGSTDSFLSIYSTDKKR